MTTSAPPRATKSTRSTPCVSIVMLAGVAEEAQPVAVRGEVDLLCAGRAVEEHRVLSALPLDDVAAVAGIPDERVVAASEEGGVVAAVAVDRVVPGAADQRLVAGAARDPVVAGASVDRRRRRVGEAAVALVDA